MGFVRADKGGADEHMRISEVWVYQAIKITDLWDQYTSRKTSSENINGHSHNPERPTPYHSPLLLYQQNMKCRTSSFILESMHFTSNILVTGSGLPVWSSFWRLSVFLAVSPILTLTEAPLPNKYTVSRGSSSSLRPVKIAARRSFSALRVRARLRRRAPQTSREGMFELSDLSLSRSSTHCPSHFDDSMHDLFILMIGPTKYELLLPLKRSKRNF